MQFQDRVSQILQHVSTDIERMRSHLQAVHAAQQQGQAPPPAEPEAWLKRLQSTYTTLEQMAQHQGKQPAHVASGDVEFF